MEGSLVVDCNFGTASAKRILNLVSFQCIKRDNSFRICLILNALMAGVQIILSTEVVIGVNFWLLWFVEDDAEGLRLMILNELSNFMIFGLLFLRENLWLAHIH